MKRIGAVMLMAAGMAAAESPVDVVTQTPGLVAFWTFGEEAGQPRRSTGTKELHPLTEVGGPIARVPGEGKKIEFWLANPEVCFEFERGVEARRDPHTACKSSFNFESVIGYGTLSEVTQPAAKENALNEIMRQYSGKTWSFEPGAVDKVRVWKTAIRSLTAKQARPK